MYKELKKGFTTGTCAALASRAAARAVITGRFPEKVSVMTPAGIEITAQVRDMKLEAKTASCAIKKYAGDDPDITDGIMVYSCVRLTDEQGIKIDGGKGVGRVTKPGLRQKIGEAAINRVPLIMIEDAVREELESAGCDKGAEVIISVPEGEAAAKKTFNPRLGIEGGISILGTSGIVEPMSEKALIDTIDAELRYKRANGEEYALIVPGNYGIDFIRENTGLDIDRAVKCSNFIGDAIDLSIRHGYNGVLLIGHAGKLIKLAAGIMNTHSKNADARSEIMVANAALCGAKPETLEKISQCVSTDEMAQIMRKNGIYDRVMERITRRIDFYMKNRCRDEIKYGVIMFSNVHGIMVKTSEADELLRLIKG